MSEEQRDITMMSNEDFHKAVDAYERWCERQGSGFDSPSQYDSREEDGFIILANVRGDLAKYNLETGRINKL